MSNSWFARTLAAAALGLWGLSGAAAGSTSTTTALTSTDTNPYTSQSITLTAAVSPSAATGSVAFKDSGGAISGCTAVAVSAGVATCTTTFTFVATHPITASYGGDATYAVSTGSISEVVRAKNTTSTAIVSSANPAYVNAPVTYTATVTGSSPTGSVQFVSNSATIATVPLSAGQASTTISYANAASRPVYATYLGDTANATSTSPTLTEVIANPPATTTTVTSSANPTVTNASVTFTANVSGNNPTGTVTFTSNGGNIGTATLSAGQASLNFSYTNTGTRPITAKYSGDVNNAASTSAAISQSVLLPVTTTLTATPTTVNQSAAVTLKATMSPTAATGQVTFKDGSTTLGTATLASGVATLPTSFSVAGTHNLTVTYAGDSTYGPSTSSAVVETVNATQQSTTTALTSSANPVAAGNSLALVATVTGNVPTGSVQFKDGGTNLGSAVQLVSGQASYTLTPSLAAGHLYSAAYAGDPTNAPSTGQVAVNVTGATSTTALNVSTIAATPTTSITLTAAVAGSSPTGTVKFREGATVLNTATVTGGVATWSQTFTTGSHAITASYSGDSTNSGSASTTTIIQISADGSMQPGAALQTNFEYDAEGNLTKVTDANAAITQKAYDSLSRATQITQPVPATGQLAPTIDLSYDLQDQLATVTDPRALQTSYTIDGLGNATAQSSPDTGGTTRTFYDSGLLKTSTDARGKTTTYTYDELDRVKTVAYSDGGTGIVYTYDQGTNGVGHLTNVTDESGSTTFTYDGLGRIATKTQVAGPSGGQKTFTLIYTWGTSGTATGKLQSVKYPSGAQVNYGYDTAGRVNDVSVLGADGVTTEILSGLTYTALGQPKSWAWGSGSPYLRTFDGYGRLVSYPLGNPNGTGNAAGVTRTLSFDAAGRIVGYSHTTPTNWDQIFGYDGLDRLTSATLTNGNTYGYAYDPTGNRTQSTINGTSYASTVASNSDWYTNVATAAGGATAQGYDAAGHLTSDAGGTYTYSGRGRLAAELRSGNTFSYLYNAFEQRVYKGGSTGVNTTGKAFYVYDEAGHLVGEYDATGKALYETVYLGDMPVAALTAPAIGQTTVSYIYADHLNTARVIVRPVDQVIVWQWGSNEPFGQSQANVNPSSLGIYTYNPRFPGQVADSESGWFYNWNRDYNPALGRYVQSDPIGLDAGSMSTYGYVDSSPLDTVDPEGLDGCVYSPFGVVCHSSAPPPLDPDNPYPSNSQPTIHWPSLFPESQNPTLMGTPPGLNSALPPAAAANSPACFAEEHTKNKRPSNWDKHTKPRPGRDSEKKRNQPGWKPNPNKPK